MNDIILYHPTSLVARYDREQLSGHKSAVLWFTGLSGAGKSTLSHGVEKALYDLGCRTFVIDGDNVRHGLCRDLGFGALDRRENIRRIGELSKLFVEAGVITLTALISPFRDDRELVRQMYHDGDFIEIYCSADIETCESRDVKGLYARARRGEIPDFTGISSPYEPPLSPELTINTAQSLISESIQLIIDFLVTKKIIELPKLG